MRRAACGVIVGGGLWLAGCSSSEGGGVMTSGAGTTIATASSSAAVTAAPSAAAAPEACGLKSKALDFVAWSPDGAFLWTGGPTEVEGSGSGGAPVRDGTIDGWDLATGQRVFTFHLGAAKQRRRIHLAFTPDGKAALATGSVHGVLWPVARWDRLTGATAFASAWLNHPDGIDASHDGGLAIFDGGGSNAVLVELPSMKVLHETSNDTAASGRMRFSKDDVSIVNQHDGAGSLDDPRTLKTKKRWSGESALSPDRTALAIAGKEPWSIVDAGSGKKLCVLEAPPKLGDGQSVLLSFSRDGRVLAVGTERTLTFWRADNGKKIGAASFDLTKNADRPWTWTRDSTLLVAGATAYDAATGKPANEADLPAGMLVPLAGHLVAVLEGEILVEIDAATGERTGRSWKVDGRHDEGEPGDSFEADFAPGPREAHFSYPRKDTGTVRIVRWADGASVDVGVVWVGGAQKGFVVSPEGSFDGPAEAAACAAKVVGKVTKPAPGLLRDFTAAARP